MGHVLTNVRTIEGRSTFEKSPDFQQMKEEQPYNKLYFEIKSVQLMYLLHALVMLDSVRTCARAKGQQFRQQCK